MKKLGFVLFWITLFTCVSMPNLFSKERIIVSQNGDGDFKSIQGALNSLEDTALFPRIIFVRKGVYREKLYIEKANVIIEGEHRDSTIVLASIARDEWRCGHMDDWGVATVNVGASGISFKNLTITNDFGFNYSVREIFCAGDTGLHKMKSLRKDGHQMALRAMNGATRMKAVNCRFRAFGGDTVSPWDVENGMWYFKDCIMEGGVDFYCPRGWAWAENCTFISLTGPAAIWHDGSAHKDSKSIFKNCIFKGYDGFMLGRYHRDAQFFLIDCTFGSNMADKPIYLVPTANVLRWGERIYFSNCRKEGGGDFIWYSNNLPSAIKPQMITTSWLFGKRWNPILN